ncbi:MAG: glycosyltransferase [Cyanobacteria bacterium]|nr:glycosyltransferase [Cyanobacteriota bacterium]
MPPLQPLPAAPDSPEPPPEAPPLQVVVVTVAYHSEAVLPVLARDLARQRQPPQLWLLVDNSPRSAPLDLEPLRAAARPPSDQAAQLVLRRLAGHQGDGFGVGCNRALNQLAAQGWDGWVWLLNPDTRLPGGEELGLLGQQLAQLSQRAVVGTAVLDDLGGLEASGGWIDLGLRFRSRRLEATALSAGRALAVDWLSGCSLALRPSAHEPPARFDPAFPLYYEDMDLCLRLSARGAPVVWLPQPCVRHHRGQGSNAGEPLRRRLSTISYLRFLRRHCPPWVLLLRTLRLLALTLLRLPLQPRRSLAVLRGIGPALGPNPCQP